MNDTFRNKVLQIIAEAIDDFNNFQETKEMKLILSESTVLFGNGSKLKSVELVRLLVDIEFKLEENFGLSDALSSDRAMSQQNSPFKTVATLTDYICSLEAEK